MNQQDKQNLLELAARACGIEHLIGFGIDSYAPYWLNDPKQPEPRYWNPLDNDGDAFRLAVKLELDIMCGSVRTDDFSVSIPIRAGTEIYAATRYAIVCAAAEIGKSMKVD